MCSIVGVVSATPVNQLVYDSLLLLQHRGQDAAGVATTSGSTFHIHKTNGMVRNVLRTRNMRSLPGASGIDQVRYPTAGSFSEEEVQPFHVNAPLGIVLAHNGNPTNSDRLREEMFRRDRRHIDTQSDSEMLLNVLADELQRASNDIPLNHDSIFTAVEGLHRCVRGSYVIAAEISGYGMPAVRNPFGIRPLAPGSQEMPDGGIEYMAASELVALEDIGFKFERDVAPGEAIFIDLEGNLYTKQCAANPVLSPCIFEYAYLARPDSRMDDVSMYDARLRMGDYLAEKIKRRMTDRIDMAMPIPDPSRPAVMQVANHLGVPHREGFFKNRYVGRTFVTPGQAVCKKSMRQKPNAMAIELKNKNVLIVDDSIVCGTASSEIVQMARDAGAKKVIFASTAPPVKFPNVYGIDMSTRGELVAYDRTREGIAKITGADQFVYQDVEDMKRAVRDADPALKDFDASCFDGKYVTGDTDEAYLDRLEAARNNSVKADRENAQNDSPRAQLHLQRSAVNE